MSDLNKLYGPVIKAGQANPWHFEKITYPSNTVKSYNAICGDRYDFFLDIRDHKIVSFHFYGYGCAVSMAAGSVLVKSLEGKSIDEATRVCNIYLDLINGKQIVAEVPEEFNAFITVRDFPARYDCATMAWVEVRKFLLKQTS